MTNKTATIQIRVSPAEKTQLQAAATKQGFALSAWIRWALLRHAKRVLVLGSLLLLAACGTSPTRPTEAPPAALTGQLQLAVAGQSNSILIRPFLEERAAVVGYGEVTAIDPCWSSQGACWAALRPQLSPALDAVIWSQGEADILAQTPDYGPQTPGRYGAALANLMARIRQASGDSTLLIVVMEKGPWAAFWETRGIAVEAETRAWVAQDGHAVMIPTRDLEWRHDAIHMTDQGYRDVAERIVTMVKAKTGR